MEQTLHISDRFKVPTIGKIPLYYIIVVFVFLLAVLQDYIYSNVKQTGFFLSESLLYNTFWIFFIPLTILTNKIVTFFNPKSELSKLTINLGIGLTFSFFHIFVFTTLFVLVSNLVFSPSHRFSAIFNTAFSNQFYIALIWYSVFPVLHIFKLAPTKTNMHYPEKIKLKIGTRIITVLTSSIQFITTDKPYSIIYANDRKILDNKSLTEFESQLDSTMFLRVHRSTIINANYVKELKTRGNGDYDATLENGQIIRLSRHYRSNWHHLLQ